MSASTLYSLVVAGAILIGIAALGAFALLAVDAQTARRIRRRLGIAGDDPEDEIDGPMDQKLLKSMARRGQSLEKLVDKEGETPVLLAQAGWRGTQPRLLFRAMPVLLLVVFGLALFIGTLSGGKWFQAPTVYLVGFGGFCLALLLPRWVLRSAAATRRQQIKSEVPLFVHLLVLLFEAGLSTRQALSSLVREGRGVLPELGSEFESVVRQLDTGADTGDVLRQLGEMLDVDDLTNVLGVLRQVDRYGGEIREPLLDLLRLLEERRGLDLRERVNLISGRMTVVMVLFFFPALLIFVAGPAFMSIIRTLSQVAGGK